MDAKRPNTVDNERYAERKGTKYFGVMSDTVYKHLNENNLLPEEQMGFCMRTGGARDQFLIDKTVAAK